MRGVRGTWRRHDGCFHTGQDILDCRIGDQEKTLFSAKGNRLNEGDRVVENPVTRIASKTIDNLDHRDESAQHEIGRVARRSVLPRVDRKGPTIMSAP